MKRGKRPGVVPTSEVPMVMLSWVDRWGFVDYGERVGYPERPPTPGLAEYQTRAIERWDAQAAPTEPPQSTRHQSPRTLYQPRWNGLLDPDPLEEDPDP